MARWPITMCHFRPSKVFRKWILIDQAYIRVDSYRLEKQFLDDRANGDAIVDRQIHQPAAGATFFRLPDVRVGNVFSVCSASYRPTSGFFYFYSSRSFQRGIYYSVQNIPRETLLLIWAPMYYACMWCDVYKWIATRVLFIARESQFYRKFYKVISKLSLYSHDFEFIR